MWYKNDFSIQLVMIPGCEEVTNYEGANFYHCGLEETRTSIEELMRSAERDFYENVSKTTDPYFANPRFRGFNDRSLRGVYGYAPDVVFNVIISLVSGGLGTAIYKLLALWLKARNGRKIHVKLPNGIVIDTTQMSHKEFSEFLSDVFQVYVKYEKNHNLIEKSIQSGRIKSVPHGEMTNITSELHEAVRKKGRQLMDSSKNKATE